MKKHLYLVHNRISPAVVAVVATIASVQFLFPGPILDLLTPTDRLVQHLATQQQHTTTFGHTHNLDAHTFMTMGQLPDRVHPTGSETKYHVFNNQITDNVDIYHSEATTLKPKACTMKYTKNIRAHTVTTHIYNLKTQRLYTNINHTAHTNHTASNAINKFLWLHKVIQIAQRHPLCRPLHNNTIQVLI